MSETFLKFTIKTLGQFSQFSDFTGKFESVCFSNKNALCDNSF